MDCREFRNKHVAFVDDLLSAVEMDLMYQHLSACSRCSKQDTAVRRSLLLVRNLPPIQLSPNFMARLNERLQQVGPSAGVDTSSPRPFVSSLGAFAALAAGVAAVAYMAIETSHYYAPQAEMRRPQIVATVPPVTESTPMPDAAFVASVPTGMPVWPAVLMVGQAPMHFANMDFGDAEQPR